MLRTHHTIQQVVLKKGLWCLFGQIKGLLFLRHGCRVAGSGGASIEDNGNANLSSPGGKVSEKGDCKWSGVVVTP